MRNAQSEICEAATDVDNEALQNIVNGSAWDARLVMDRVTRQTNG